MAFTVVPLHNIELEPGTHIQFANGLVFQDVPEWVKKEQFLSYLSYTDRQNVLHAYHAFVAEYEAASIGEPDPKYQGERPKSIQEAKFESAMLGNFALWLGQPSKVCLKVGLHGLSWKVPGQVEKQPVIQQSHSQRPLYCHPSDFNNPVTLDHVKKAADLHRILCQIPRDNPVWVAMRAFWSALTTYPPDIRYSLFWIGLEALFGPDDASAEITYKLAQRISFLTSQNSKGTRELFQTAKKCYSVRSKIIHGRSNGSREIEVAMLNTERITRTAFRHLIENPDMLRTFISKQRDRFLEDWVFSRSTDTPPFPAMP